MRFLPKRKPSVAVIRLNGVIGGGSRIGTELCDEFVHPFEEVFARQ